MSQSSEKLNSEDEILEVLPAELLLKVMERVEQRNWKRSLLELMLTCKTAYSLGLSLLWRRFDFGELRVVHIDAFPVDVFGNEKLSKIRRLAVSGSIGRSGEGYQSLLEKIFPSLEELDFSDITRSKYPSPFFETLKYATRLKKLELMCSTKIVNLAILICKFPPLVEHLVVSFGFGELSEQFRLVVEADWPKLKKVELKGIDRNSIATVLNEHPLFSAKVTTFGIYAGCLAELDNRSFPNLQTLNVTGPPPRGFRIHEQLPRFPSLQSVELSCDQKTRDMPFILAKAPESLNHIRINFPHFNLPQTLFGTVKELLAKDQIRVTFNEAGWRTPEGQVDLGSKEEVEFWRSLDGVTWNA
jgi:hypothetical protein